MGIVGGCSEGCYTWVKGYNEKVSKLRLQYRTYYKNSIYFQLCMNFVQQMHLINELGHGTEQEAEGSYRGSLLSSHYDQAIMASDKNNIKQDSNKLPSRIASLTNLEKKQLISDLIKRSYILLDISDIFKQQQNSSYESHIKHKIFQNDVDLSDSFLERRDHIVQSLRKFNTATIFKLQSYIQLSQKIKKSFTSTSDSLLSKFLINLKAKSIQTYNNDQNIQKLFKNIGIITQIIEDTVIILFGIKIQNDSPNPQGQMGQNNAQQASFYTVEEQRLITFLNQTNFYTLISSIIFDDINFQDFLEKVISQKFKAQIFKYKQMSPSSDSGFVAHITGQTTGLQSYFQPTITALFNKKVQKCVYFQKTTKMFAKLPNKLPPILKLKILYEIQKQFLKQMKVICTSKGVEMVYDRMTSQLMVSWLMNRDKAIGEKNILSIILAYAFVHTAYRLGSKGSTVLSFVENVQKILSWSIPDV